MPIPRDKIERGPPPDPLVIEFRDGHPESACTAGEIEVELRRKGDHGGSAGDSMFGKEGSPDLKSLLETRALADKIQRKEMDRKAYYCTAKPVPSASPTTPGAAGADSRAPAPSDSAH